MSRTIDPVPWERPVGELAPRPEESAQEYVARRLAPEIQRSGGSQLALEWPALVLPRAVDPAWIAALVSDWRAVTRAALARHGLEAVSDEVADSTGRAA